MVLAFGDDVVIFIGGQQSPFIYRKRDGEMVFLDDLSKRERESLIQKRTMCMQSTRCDDDDDDDEEEQQRRKSFVDDERHRRTRTRVFTEEERERERGST